MAVGMLMQAPGLNAELYDSVLEHMEWKERDLPAGLVSHYAGLTKWGWFVFDVWDSQEDFESFAQERLMPAMAAAAGGQPPSIEPHFFPIHNEDHAKLRV